MMNLNLEKEKPLLKLEPKDKLVLKWINESFFTTCHKIKETKDHEGNLKTIYLKINLIVI